MENVPIGVYLQVVYRNWEGVLAERRIRTLSRVWGSSRWHPGDQWLIDVIDLDKGELRTFAETGIESWIFVSGSVGTSAADSNR